MWSRETVERRYRWSLFLFLVLSMGCFLSSVRSFVLFWPALVILSLGFWRYSTGKAAWIGPRLEPLFAIVILGIFMLVYETSYGKLLHAGGFFFLGFMLYHFFKEGKGKTRPLFTALLPALSLTIIASFLTNDFSFLLFFLGQAIVGGYLLFYRFLVGERVSTGWQRSELIPGGQVHPWLLRSLRPIAVFALALISIVIGFVIIPRTDWEVDVPYHLQTGQVGFDQQMNVGKVKEIIVDGSVAFVVKTSAQPDLFKGQVYNDYDGRQWYAHFPQRDLFPDSRDHFILPQAKDEILPQGVKIRETYTIVHAVGENLFYRGQPTEVQAERPHRHSLGEALKTDVAGNLRVEQTFEGLTYTISTTFPAWSAESLRQTGTDYPAAIAKTYLSLPTISSRVKGLAQKLATGHRHSYDVALAICDYLQRTYPYSLKASGQGEEVADHFLFTLQKGYCEYFATAMVVLLRAQGIPARLVGGFRPGPYDLESRSYLILNRYAHAWVEVYFPGAGWMPFDPTPAGEEERSPWWERAYYFLRRQWYNYVVSFSRFQQDYLIQLLKEGLSVVKDHLWACAVITFSIVVLWMLRQPYRFLGQSRLRWRRAPPKGSPLRLPPHVELSQAFYRRMVELLAARGLARTPWDTPRELEQKVADSFPSALPPVSRLTQDFYEIRFGDRPLTERKRADWEEALAELAVKLPPKP